MTRALAKVREAGWRNVSLSQLRSFWPTELVALDCDAHVCQSVRSEDRIVRSHCQCCATFYFDIKKDAGGSETEQLQNIVINYTSNNKDQLVATAKSLAEASGIKQSDLARIGRSPEQNFTWDEKDGTKDLYGIELHIAPRGKLWELYFNMARHATDSR
jgi:hypothetical protein